MKFYYDLMSQPSRALYIFFKLNQVPITFVPVALRNGEHLTEEYKKNINRFQRVPCIIDDDGWKLSETVAIFRYQSVDVTIEKKRNVNYFQVLDANAQQY